ncbi:MAG: SDR family NAD(P)-dependent oxidoreductase [Streptosporangiaceae bacterium]|nr:SDR family NAD(P)-dependent oxidoreductase [Streptosporangiaceae bacterium]
MPERTRTIVMTGATSGIGAHALQHLTAQPGTRALIGARPSSARPASPGTEVLPLDLSSLAEVRAFAAAVLGRLDGDPVDVLVLNAGTQFMNTRARSADGYELTFAVNHLAHYLLARLLLPAVADGGRVILTTSDTHDPRVIRSAPRSLDIDAWARPGGSSLVAYSASKLGNLLTAEKIAVLPETAERHITSIAFNPGLTGGTGLSRSAPAAARVLMQGLRPVFMLLSRFRPALYMNTPEHAGQTLAQLADGTFTPPADRVYASLVRGNLEYPDPSDLARNPAARDEMWHRSAELTGLTRQE